MATISAITIPADKLTRLMVALKYQVQVSDGQGGLITNPETPTQRARRFCVESMRHEVLEFEAELNMFLARDAALLQDLSDIT